jgi:hypothetical protein
MFQTARNLGPKAERAPKDQIVLVASPWRVFRLLARMIAVLLVLQFVALALRYGAPDFPLRDTFVHSFLFDEEANVPTWYSSSVLLLCSALLGVIAYSTRRVGGRFVGQWTVLAIIFLALSVDEEAALHEGAIRLRETFGLGGIFYYAWVIPGLIFVAILAITMFRLLLSLPPRSRALFLGSGVVFLSGAIGLEMVSAARAEVYGKNNLTQDVLTTVEELLEMSGAALFVYALLDYIRRHVGPVLIRWKRA